MKIYRVYRDDDLFAYLLDRYMLFYACMKRGCDTLPRVTKMEKEEVLRRISESDESTNYAFWTYLEPGEQKGRWEGPPDDPFLHSSSETEEDSPSSKRSLETDGAADVRKLQCTGEGVRTDTTTIHGAA
jgi:hypothetical protein